MALLSRPIKRRTPARSTRAAMPLVVLEGGHAQLSLANTRIDACAEGALWLAQSQTLIVSDLHLEKGSSYAPSGQLLPPYDTRTTLRRLTAVMKRVAPKRVVSLGDSFHDLGGPARMDAADRAVLLKLTASVEWVWIEGNHDPAIPSELGGVARDEVEIDGLVLRHEPTGAEGEVAGHLHPCAKVAGRGRTVRARCFATDGVRLVMPAFGAYTGGLNLRDVAFAPVFPNGAMALIMGRGRVFPAPHDKLIGD